jgi:diguanylate cyclase (GGDEF)-like protein/PAS domain S-box-containing protein
VFTQARAGMMITSVAGEILDVNAAFTRITGFSRAEALGRSPAMLRSGRQGAAFYTAMWAALHGQGYWEGEVWNRRRSGEVYAQRLIINAICDSHGRPSAYVGLFSDITALKREQAELEHDANHDALTGLPNRRQLTERLRLAIAGAPRRRLSTAVVYIDLDGFKAVNDQYGHARGDELLVALAARMRNAVRESDTVARLGGDEFVVLLQDLEGKVDCTALLERLRDACAQPVRMAGRQVRVSASIGVAMLRPGEPAEAHQLLRMADQAMYQAKLGGKNRYHFFDAAPVAQRSLAI